MRAVIWFMLLFAVAVVAARTLGTNDGLVSFYWAGWRLDVSLNLFLLLLVGTCFALVADLPGRQLRSSACRGARSSGAWRGAIAVPRPRCATRWRSTSAAATAARRSRRSARSSIQGDTPELAQDNEFTVLGHLLAAGSPHRLQDRAGRDEQLQARARPVAAQPGRAARGGGRTHAGRRMGARRPRRARALELLAELPRRGTAHACAAPEAAGHAPWPAPQEALKTARLLAKHQGFSKDAAQGLLRSLAFEALETARDADQVRRIWQQLDPADRRDPFVAARAATRAARARRQRRSARLAAPVLGRLSELHPDDREVLAQALVAAVHGIGPDWLPRLEAAVQAYPREAALALAAGSAMAERQLWGKARRLQQAADDTSCPPVPRRRAWRHLAGWRTSRPTTSAPPAASSPPRVLL